MFLLKLLYRIVRGLFSQMVIVGLLLVVQVAFLVLLVVRLNEYFAYFYTVLVAISLLATLQIVNRTGSPASKLAWVVCILAVPLLGVCLYLIVYSQRHPRRIGNRLEAVNARLAKHLPQNHAEGAEGQDAQRARMLRYMRSNGGAVAVGETETEYYPLGEDMKAAMLAAIERAEHYVFLEFFIIKDGVFWREIKDLLAKKAAEGVEIRLMYDGIGCLTHLPIRYPRRLREMGLKAKVFSPFTPVLSTIQNHRDHRKIVIVDGHTAFCGGVNLADEYININSPYGHWKDTAVRVRGAAAWAFTLMFLSLWDMTEAEPSDCEALRPRSMPGIDAQGFVMPYTDSPMDNEKVGEYMYMHAINGASRYLHIMTPYLIMEQGMVDAMIAAAKSGVEVKLILPSRADHWYAHAVAMNYYRELAAGGVGLYAYSPGFVHAKSFVWDDREAIVGTINLDYRSLYLHFECACWMADSPTVAAVEADFQQTLKQCRQLEAKDYTVRNPVKRLVYSFLGIFAPLM